MKSLRLILTIVLAPLYSTLGVDQPNVVTDPVADYIARHKDDFRKDDEKNEHVIELEIDIDHDGKKDLLLASQKSSLFDSEYKNSVYVWDMYRKLSDGQYALIDQKKSSDETVKGQSIDLDPDKIYVGYIDEIKAWGILATYYLPKHSEVGFSAFVLRDGYFEDLNFPHPQNPTETYHLGDANTIPDLPQAYAHYFASPSTAKIVVLPQTY